MSWIKSVLQRVLGAIVFAAFAFFSYLCLFEGSFFLKLDSLHVALGACGVLLLCAGVYFLGRRIKFKNSASAAKILLVLALALYLPLQIYCAYSFETDLGASWDFGLVASAAAEAAQNGTPSFEVIGNYLNMWPNNVPLYMLLTGVFKVAKLMGITNFGWVGIAINILSIDASIFIAYLTVRKVSSSRAAAFTAILIAVLTLPLLAYTAIFYTDTLTLIFPVLTLFLWTCAKNCVPDRKKYYAFLAGAVVVNAIGALLKLSVLIALIAVLVDMLIVFRPKKAAASALVAAVVFCVVYLPVQKALLSSELLPEYDRNSYVPKLHWVMMGLHGNGGYFDPDYKLTLSVPGDERDEVVTQEIKRRIEEYGLTGMLEHLHEKCSYVFGEGTYYSAMKLERDRVRQSPLDRYGIYYKRNFPPYAHFCQSVFLLMQLGVVVSGILILRKKNKPHPLLPFSVASLGLALFMCIWEARSRYLLNFVPVFAVIFAVCLAETIGKISWKRKQRN